MVTRVDPSPAALIDNPQAPEWYATEAVGFMNTLGNIHITLAAPRATHTTVPGPVNRVVIGRIVLPVAGAQALAAGLYDFLKSQGMDPNPVPGKNELQ